MRLGIFIFGLCAFPIAYFAYSQLGITASIVLGIIGIITIWFGLRRI